MSGSGDFYNKISPIYPLINASLATYKKPLISYLQQQKQGCILDIGCGQGSLHKYGLQHNITGVDYSKKMLDKAIKRYPNHTFMLASAHQLPFQAASFDMVVCAHVLSTVQDLNIVLAQIHKVLKRGGSLIVLNHFSTIKPRNTFIYKTIQRIFGLAQFQYYFSPQQILNALPPGQVQFSPIGNRGFALLVYTKNI